MKNLADKYWSQVIDDYTSCFGGEIKLSKAMKNRIIDKILNHDYLWEVIDDVISECILKEVNK